MRKTLLGVHNFVLGCASRIRYSRAVACATQIPTATKIPRWNSPPTLNEISLLAGTTAVFFVLVIAHFRDYRSVVYEFGDSQAYSSVALAIRHWNFAGLQVKQFWGYPYVIAAVSVVTGISEQNSLLVVSCICSFLSTALAFRLWGGRVAGWFAVLSFDWMQRAYLGGAEPLFVALVFAAFLAARREQFSLAALLGSLSTIVRPLGIFCLLGISLVHLRNRDFKRLAATLSIGAAVAVLYMLPLAKNFGDPLATVHSYQGPDRMLFGIPFYAIVKGTITNPSTVSSLLLSFSWIFFVLAGAGAAFFDAEFKAYAKQNLLEIMFAAPYLLLVCCYNYPVFARSNFARFAIPVIPFVLLSLARWLPRDRRILWSLGIVMPVLAAASALGIRNVIHMLHT